MNPAVAAKKSEGGKDAAGSASGSEKKFVYCDESSLETTEIEWVMVCWPKNEDEDEEEEEDEEGNTKELSEEEKKHRQKIHDEIQASPIIGEKGFKISKQGREKFFGIMNECERRDQDNFGMYICNDWSGYGVIEVLENFLIEFNKVLFKKDVSARKKWAFAEGLATWVTMGDLGQLMMNENSESINEIFNIFSPLVTTSLSILAEHSLTNDPSSNARIIAILLLDFIIHGSGDYEVEGADAIVRKCEEVGLELGLEGIKGLSITEEEIEELKEQEGEVVQWKKVFTTEWKRNHVGGKHYDITKMSKAQKKSRKL